MCYHCSGQNCDRCVADQQAGLTEVRVRSREVLHKLNRLPLFTLIPRRINFCALFNIPECPTLSKIYTSNEKKEKYATQLKISSIHV